jgi:hypothetical protein
VDSLLRNQMRTETSSRAIRHFSATSSYRVAMRWSCLAFVEEALDEVARLVDERAETDRVFAVGLGQGCWPTPFALELKCARPWHHSP